jgi:lipid-binding SYLF domain-containing protein
MLLRDAAGVAIVPHLVKAGLVLSGSSGRGVVMARMPDGRWADPVFIDINGKGIGGQVGIEATELVLVFKSRRSLDLAMRGKLTLGGDVTVAAGPLGRDVEVAKDRLLKTDIFTYSRSKGLFVGVSLTGNRVLVDGRATEDFQRHATPVTVDAVRVLKHELDCLAGLPAVVVPPVHGHPPGR